MANFDDGSFSLIRPLWFVALKPLSKNVAGLILQAIRLKRLSLPVDARHRVPAFTDRERAARFVERYGDAFAPFAFEHLAYTGLFLQGLIALGNTHLVFNPEKNRGRTITIQRVIGAIQNVEPSRCLRKTDWEEEEFRSGFQVERPNQHADAETLKD